MSSTVPYRLIENGRVIAEQQREYDVINESVAKAVERDQYDGMCPLEMCRKGEPVRWVEARIR